MTQLDPTYDLSLVALSYLVAVAAAYSALDLTGLASRAIGSRRLAWVAAGGVSLGFGIWSMHFVGMLAFHLPLPVSYDVGLVVLSVVFAIVSSAFALGVASGESLSVGRASAAAALTAAGIVGMHYIGMAAMIVDAVMSYDPTLVAASMVIALVASFVAIQLFHRLRGSDDKSLAATRLIAALVMGAAVAGMHYTGMAAARFSIADPSRLGGYVPPGSAWLAAGIAGAAILVASLSFLASLFRSEGERRRVAALAGILGSVAVLVGSVSLTALYGTWIGVERDNLQQMARAQARIISATAQLGEELRGEDQPEGAVMATVSRVQEAHRGLTGFGATGEWVLGREVGGSIVLLLHDSETIDTAAVHAAPIRRALAGESGVTRGLDVHGVPVLAAFEHIPELDLGLVAKVDLAELRSPFLRTALLTGGAAVLLAILGSIVLLRVTNPLLATVEQHALLRSLINNTRDLIFYKDTQGVYRGCNYAFADFIGRTEAEIVGKTDNELFGSDRADTFVESDREVFDTGEARSTEEWATYPDGTEALLDTLKTPFFGPDGQRLGIIGMSRDISDRKRLEEQLRSMAQDAERANRMKSAFLANMSHEIRTPMNGVLGMTALLLDTELTPEQRQSAEVVKSCADGLLAVIDDILDLSKIEAGHLDLEIVPFDLLRTVDHAARMLAVKAIDQSVELIIDVDPDVPRWVSGDPVRLRQVMTNLIGNAVKFTNDGEVVVEVSSSGTDGENALVEFSVRDTGIGIPPDKRDLIFEEFAQADSTTTRHYGGTGLGLPICRRLVDMQGGTLEVESVVGAGSRFYFTLPLAPAEAQETDVIGDVDLEGRRFLVVDDHEINRRIIRRDLEASGATVVEASNGLAALALLQEDDGRWDTVLIDHLMPGMDGFELAAKIRAIEEFGGLNLLMVTSAGKTDDAKQAREIGIQAYLAKPVARIDLVRALAVLLEGDVTEGRLVTKQAIDAATDARRILLAEDNAVNQEVAGRMLRKRGHAVRIVSTGREALDALEQERFDLILMDVQMPEMDGVEATRRIREGKIQADIPIVALTAHALAEEREHCLSAGMDEFLSKPFKPDELFAIVEAWRRPDSRSGTSQAPKEAPTAVTEVAAHPDAPANLEEFRAFMREAGVEDGVEAALGVFLAEAESRIATLRMASESGDADQMEFAAHSMKSASRNIYASRLGDLLEQIEQASGNADVQRASELVPIAMEEAERVVRYVEGALNS